MVTARLLRREDAGAVAVITAICSLVLFGVAAMTVDLGRLWEVRRQSQSEVDLAALAGALHLPGTPILACTTALKYLRANTPVGQSPEDIDPDTMCTASGTSDGQVEISNNASRITVRTHPKVVNFGLAGAMGFKNGATGAQATAEIRSPGGLDPFSVAVTNEYGGQCIHDNTNGHSRAVTAALLAPAAQPSTATITEIDDQGSNPPTKVTTIGIGEQPPLTIQGTGFKGTKTVIFGSAGTVAVGNAAVTDTTIDVTPPVVTQPLGPIDVTVSDANSTSANNPPNDQLTWAYITPVVTSVSPPSGAAGTAVTITGRHFGGNIQVFFGGTQAQVQPGATTSSLPVLAPAGAAGTTVDVTVKNSTGTSATSVADQFTYLATPPPSIVGVTPSQGANAGGTSVTITGTGFVNGATSVKFGSNAATAVNVTSATSLTATSPAGTAGTVDVTATTTFGTSATTQLDRFTYGAVPTVTGITPNTGPSTGGTVVTITGTNFGAPGDVVAVTFQPTAGGIGLPATNVNVVNSTTITATSPAGNGSADVIVTTGFGASATSNSDLFTYIVNGCTDATGDFGYLDVPRNDATGANTLLELNIILGLDHTPSIYPAPPGGSAPNNDKVANLPLNYECTTNDASAIIDPNQSPYVDGINCLDVQNGNKASVAGAAFLDSFQGHPGKLVDPPSGHKTATIGGRPNIDNDSFYDFLEPGVTPAQINADLLLANAGAQANPVVEPLLTTDQDLINPDILACPRFTILPVLHTDENPQNGQHAVQNFVGAFVQDFSFQGGGSTPNVATVTAITFPLSWLPGGGANADNTIPFLGTGPVVPVLVK
jgi:Flp pilus assembly protein TadG